MVTNKINILPLVATIIEIISDNENELLFHVQTNESILPCKIQGGMDHSIRSYMVPGTVVYLTGAVHFNNEEIVIVADWMEFVYVPVFSREKIIYDRRNNQGIKESDVSSEEISSTEENVQMQEKEMYEFDLSHLDVETI